MSFKDNARLFLTAEEDIGKRLDQFVAENTDLSRTFSQKLIKAGEVLVDDVKIMKVAHTLNENQEVRVHIPEPKTLDIEPENIPLDILYEDDDVLVINKAAGMVVHPDDTHSSGTLVNALLGYLGTEKLSGIGGVKRPGIVHRLDKDTSGVMIIAKNDHAHRHLTTEIAERRVTKRYKTLVFGKVKHETFSIDAPIGRDLHDRKKMAVSNATAAREALSHVSRETTYTDPLCSYLNVHIVTGRTHQIRVHLASVGHPVVADPLYGNETLNEKFQKDFPLERIFLHSHYLALRLPSGEEKEFTAPLLADLQRVLEMLEY